MKFHANRFTDKSYPRGTKKEWVKYMLANPIYFETQIGEKFTPENVISYAEKAFKLETCECCGGIFPAIKCKPTGGISYA